MGVVVTNPDVPVRVSLTPEQLESALSKARREGADQVHMTAMFAKDRLDFIRRAAIAFAERGYEPEQAWARAQSLWKAKPEDC